MKCDECTELLAEYREGALPEDEARKVGEHLAGCANCAREGEALERLTEAARRLPVRAPGAGGVLRIREAVHRPAAGARRTEFGPVMDMEELAEFLRTGAETLASYLDEIPAFELGGKLLFRRKSIEEWIARRETRLGFRPKEFALFDNAEMSATVMRGGVPWKMSGKN